MALTVEHIFIEFPRKNEFSFHVDEKFLKLYLMTFSVNV